MSMQRTLRAVPLPRWRAECPFGLLVAAAIASPFFVLDQGGDWHTAILAGFIVLGVPGAAVESMTGLARVALLLRDGAI